MKLLEKVIGAALFTACFLLFVSSLFGMAEQSVKDSERYAQEARLDELNSRADDVYISPSDEVAIELMNKE